MDYKVEQVEDLIFLLHYISETEMLEFIVLQCYFFAGNVGEYKVYCRLQPTEHPLPHYPLLLPWIVHSGPLQKHSGATWWTENINMNIIFHFCYWYCCSLNCPDVLNQFSPAATLKGLLNVDCIKDYNPATRLLAGLRSNLQDLGGFGVRNVITFIVMFLFVYEGCLLGCRSAS